MIKSSVLAGVAAAVMFCASSAMAQMPPQLPAEALVDHADPAKVEAADADLGDEDLDIVAADDEEPSADDDVDLGGDDDLGVETGGDDDEN